MKPKRGQRGVIGLVLGTALLASLCAGGTTRSQSASNENGLGLLAAIVDPLTPMREAERSRRESSQNRTSTEKISWRRSKAIGRPWAGRLVNAVRLPAEGRHFFTWDAVTNASPNPAWRRYGTDRLVRLLLRVVDEHARAHPDAPRVAISDLSRPRGGDFGSRFGGLGHSSHQNGLDVDIYYPRKDRRERAPRSPDEVDRMLAQDLVDRFVRAGAQFVFVGPNTGLTGPARVVQPLVYHDDHMHVRIRP